MRSLDAHFLPQVNVPFERHQFRRAKQEDSETADQFVTRLFQLAKLHVDESVKPVAQKLRPQTFGLRDKIEQKLNELVDFDIIEPVEGPTPWVSPVVVVPKPTGEIRLCVNMRKDNEAIVRERHPIPSVDDVLYHLNGSTMFSKLDLKWGFHQIELEQESRTITTFITHKGLSSIYGGWPELAPINPPNT